MEKFKSVPDESVLFSLSPEEVSVLFFAMGMTASASLTIDEMNALANGLFLMAQVLFTIASQRALLNSAAKPEEETETVAKLAEEMKKQQRQIAVLQQQIQTLCK